MGFWSIKQAQKRMRKDLEYIGLWPEKTPNQNPFFEPQIDLINDAKAWELFQYFRSEIKHEHALLTGRVTWYITCQSLLGTSKYCDYRGGIEKTQSHRLYVQIRLMTDIYDFKTGRLSR
jgi:hypothetical protein